MAFFQDEDDYLNRKKSYAKKAPEKKKRKGEIILLYQNYTTQNFTKFSGCPTRTFPVSLNRTRRL